MSQNISAQKKEDTAEIERKKAEKLEQRKKCFDYMTEVSQVLSRQEYCSFTRFLQTLRDDYETFKMDFYISILFKLFFPRDMKDRNNIIIPNVENRKQLFRKTSLFYPKMDRVVYTQKLQEKLEMEEEYIRNYHADPLVIDQVDAEGEGTEDLLDQEIYFVKGVEVDNNPQHAIPDSPSLEIISDREAVGMNVNLDVEVDPHRHIIPEESKTPSVQNVGDERESDERRSGDKTLNVVNIGNKRNIREFRRMNALQKCHEENTGLSKPSKRFKRNKGEEPDWLKGIGRKGSKREIGGKKQMGRFAHNVMIEYDKNKPSEGNGSRFGDKFEWGKSGNINTGHQTLDSMPQKPPLKYLLHDLPSPQNSNQNIRNIEEEDDESLQIIPAHYLDAPPINPPSQTVGLSLKHKLPPASISQINIQKDHILTHNELKANPICMICYDAFATAQ